MLRLKRSNKNILSAIVLALGAAFGGQVYFAAKGAVAVVETLPPCKDQTEALCVEEEVRSAGGNENVDTR